MEYPDRLHNHSFLISENKRGPAMQGNGLAGSSTRLSLAPPTAWCYEQTNDATYQPSGGHAPPDGVIQWAERLWLVPEQVAGEYRTCLPNIRSGPLDVLFAFENVLAALPLPKK